MTLDEVADAVMSALATAGRDAVDYPITRPTRIDGESGVIGVEDNAGGEWFVEVFPA